MGLHRWSQYGLLLLLMAIVCLFWKNYIGDYFKMNMKNQNGIDEHYLQNVKSESSLEREERSSLTLPFSIDGINSIRSKNKNIVKSIESEQNLGVDISGSGWDLTHLFSTNGSLLDAKELKEVKLKHFYKLRHAKTEKEFLQYYSATCQHRNFANVPKTERCSCVPHGLEGPIRMNTSEPTWAEVIGENPDVRAGGEYRPTSCTPLQRVAVIIPYRDRQPHLKMLLRHLHGMLQRQQLHYRIYAADEDAPGVFNNMAMVNIAYLEAKKRFKPNCLVFNDVEKMAEDDRHFYMCEDAPLHHSYRMSSQGYKIELGRFVGGVLAMPAWIFEKANGYSLYNFMGWGGQDDEMYARLKIINETIDDHTVRFPPFLSKFTMLEHETSGDFPFNTFRPLAFDETNVRSRMMHDGLINTEYILDSYTEKPLYTHIKATLVSPLLQYTYARGEPACKNKKIIAHSFTPLMECAKKCTSSKKCEGFTFLWKRIPGVLNLLKKRNGPISTCFHYSGISCGDTKTSNPDFRIYRKKTLCKNVSNNPGVKKHCKGSWILS